MNYRPRPRKWVLALALTLSSVWAAPVTMSNAGFELGMTDFTTFGTVQSRTAFGTYFPNEGVRMAWAETSAADESAGFTWQTGNLQPGDTLRFAYWGVQAHGVDSSFILEFQSPDVFDSIRLETTNGWTAFEYIIPGAGGGGNPNRFSAGDTSISWLAVSYSDGASFLLVDALKENTTPEPATLGLVIPILGLMILVNQRQHAASRR